jgi:hypothetical protein
LIAEPFVTYGGATVSSYAASHAPINPGLPAPRHVLTGPQRTFAEHDVKRGGLLSCLRCIWDWHIALRIYCQEL